MPHKAMRSMANASAVLKAEPTLCILRTLSMTMTIGVLSDFLKSSTSGRLSSSLESFRIAYKNRKTAHPMRVDSPKQHQSILYFPPEEKYKRVFLLGMISIVLAASFSILTHGCGLESLLICIRLIPS